MRHSVMPCVSKEYRCIRIYSLSFSITDLVDLRANILPFFSLRSATRGRHPVGNGRSRSSEVQAVMARLLAQELPSGGAHLLPSQSESSDRGRTFSRRELHPV